mmetsp:Transcript_18417/g.46428  ORF Transcript_18417/g.46428 Transcript_18417/m.46428 type:complete len:303 (+) Transcript_18417:1213-2121(+)
MLARGLLEARLAAVFATVAPAAADEDFEATLAGLSEAPVGATLVRAALWILRAEASRSAGLTSRNWPEHPSLHERAKTSRGGGGGGGGRSRSPASDASKSNSSSTCSNWASDLNRTSDGTSMSVSSPSVPFSISVNSATSPATSEATPAAAPNSTHCGTACGTSGGKSAIDVRPPAAQATKLRNASATAGDPSMWGDSSTTRPRPKGPATQAGDPLMRAGYVPRWPRRSDSNNSKGSTQSSKMPNKGPFAYLTEKTSGNTLPATRTPAAVEHKRQSSVLPLAQWSISKISTGRSSNPHMEPR